ncbi:NAD(P)H-binding protein [bacterium]|nr:NAD(P)H-binding protein [bacterium]
METTHQTNGLLFLTGATGHTGSRLARRLLADGWRVRCLLHTASHASYLPKDPALEVVEGDIQQPLTWSDKLAGAHAMFNLAHVGYAPFVIQACGAAGVKRMISMSSTRRFTKFPERTARLVMAGEAAIEQSDLDYTVIRSAMIFGGDRDNNLEKIVRWLRRIRVMPLIGGGQNLVQPIFVWDLVEALVTALAKPETTARRMLTVAGPAPMTWRSMIETIANVMCRPVVCVTVPVFPSMIAGWMLEKVMKKPFVTRDQVRRQLENKTFDITEARTALGGWSPRPFAEAIRFKLSGKA